MEKKIRSRIFCGVLATTLACSCVMSSCQFIPGFGNTEDGNSYTITLNYNDSKSRDSKKYVDEGEALAEPKDPTREGYSFVGWATSATAKATMSMPTVTNSKADRKLTAPIVVSSIAFFSG